MQNCLGIYIENNLIKYAKVSKDKSNYKVEAFGMKFSDNISSEDIKKVVEETYSFNTPVSINIANEKYLYFDVFALLSKTDIQKTVQTEFEAFCDENKYNPKAFETRYALVPNVENSEKIKAIDIIVNKIELNKQKQFLEKYNLTKITPIGTSIANIVKLEKKENALIVNMEEKTTITTIYDRQIYHVETLDSGSTEVLEKINRIENSLSRAYEICKDTTIYTSNLIESTREQTHLANILPTLYQISQSVQKIVEESAEKINTIYLTGTLSVVNNVDLYFQELIPTVECKILKPNIIEETVTGINIKDYVEVNSAISLAMQGLGEGIQNLNFKNISFSDKLKQLSTIEVGKKNQKKSQDKPKKTINISFSGTLDNTEIMLVRALVAIILINVIFTVFSKMLYKQMDKKQTEVQGLIALEQAEISKINGDNNSLNAKNTKYLSLTEELKAINDKISNIAAMKNSIPNLLNQIMYIIPEEAQLVSIENTSGRKIQIVAQAKDYDPLGYFIAKLKVEGYLKDIISSYGQKNGDTVKVTIEGDLP